MFDRIGLAERVIFPATKRVSVKAPEVLLSSNIIDYRHPAHYCSEWAIGYLRQIFDVEDHSAHPAHKLFISRADATGRQILNWEEVLPVLHRHGFQVVELTRLSLGAQISLFQHASHVVGVHGAGLTNILFAPRNCAVLEILPPLVATRAYWYLASRLGQRYSALIAEDPELSRPDYRTWQHNETYIGRDIILIKERLEAALNSL